MTSNCEEVVALISGEYDLHLFAGIKPFLLAASASTLFRYSVELLQEPGARE